MLAISAILDNYLLRKKKLKKWYLVMLHYHEIVGSTIANNTRIVSIHEGKIIISCRNSIWKRELENFKDTILEKLQPHLNQDKISEIVLIIGNVAVFQKKKRKKVVELSTDDEMWIKQMVDKTHPAYKEMFGRFIRSYKEKQRS
ncbi:MAG: DciA family protein [Caldisericia bacterium]|nr:DciA family protein [Caldisericia bacterium]